MPNWCENSLEVFGDTADIIKFANDCEGNIDGEDVVLSFNSIIPEPTYEDYLKTDDWYNWRIDSWGVKWDANYVSRSFGPESIAYDFDTAWGPPDAFVVESSRLYPTLTFVLTFAEPGMDFSGRLTFSNGYLNDCKEGDYEMFGQFDFSEEEIEEK